MEGYIKLYRKLLTSAVFDNPCLLKTFVWCLLKASRAENDQMVGLQTVHVMPGQFIYGRLKAGAELSLNPSTAHKYMLCLKSLKMVDIKGNSKYSLVTVVNWAFYQSDEQKHDSNRDSKRDNNVTAKYQQRDTNKNVKNVKKEDIPNGISKKESEIRRFIPPTAAEVEAYCTARRNGVDVQMFVDFYEAKGWMVGKNRMKDWKAAVRTWERRGGNAKAKDEYADVL